VSDEFVLRKQVEQGVRAKSVLDSDAFQNAFQAVRQAIVDQWENCPIRDREGAHELKLMLKIHTDLGKHLQKAVADGEFAAEELKRDKTFTQKLTERLRIA
jgi:hypothetical protein